MNEADLPQIIRETCIFKKFFFEFCSNLFSGLSSRGLQFSRGETPPLLQYVRLFAFGLFPHRTLSVRQEGDEILRRRSNQSSTSRREFSLDNFAVLELVTTQVNVINVINIELSKSIYTTYLQTSYISCILRKLYLKK